MFFQSQQFFESGAYPLQQNMRGMYYPDTEDFGLLMARLGLLFTDLAEDQPLRPSDIELVDLGLDYFSRLIKAIESVEKGNYFQAPIETFSFVVSGPHRGQLGPTHALKRHVSDMQKLLDESKAKVGRDKLLAMATLFTNLSRWAMEENTARFFSSVNDAKTLS